ncbi:MAG: cobalamin biosynthesis protein CobQ [Actinomyces succiniciruminis]|nr:cobalamin biosynthesis protein CobQ [Actinomyces succiniciruminis]
METAPLVPNVRVLLAGTADGAQPAAQPPAVPEGFPADIVRACTGAEPVVAAPGEDPLGSARALLAEADTSAVLLLTRQGSPEVPTQPGIVVGGLERCCAPDGADHLIVLLLSAQHPPRARLLVVVGARGGLGASTFLLHLARACHARGSGVAIVDADPAGCLGLLMGDGVLPGLRWADLPDDEPAFRPEKLTTALPTWLGMPVLTGDGRGGPHDPQQLRPVLDALRAEHDLVLLDLPRGWPVPQGATVLLVSGLDLRSAVAAEALAARFQAARRDTAPAGAGADAPPGLYTVVRKLGEDVSPDELALMTRTEILAVLPHERTVAQRIARGDDPTRGRGTLRAQARAVAERLLGDVEAPEGASW